MQKVIYLLVFIFLVSCSKQQSKEYAKFSGLIANNSAKEVSIIGKGYKKVIPINADGTFSDTLKVKVNGYHTFFDGKNKHVIFISNGDNQNFNYDYNDFNNSAVVSGLGSETSNFLKQKTAFDLKEKMNNINHFYKLKEDVFTTRINFLESEVKKMLSIQGVDSTILKNQKTHYERFFKRVKSKHKKEHLLTTSLGKGKASPKFANYLNYKGGKTSLNDLKGKYVYVDVWATWCGPCKQQIPFLAKIEKEYHGKNIEFVSISVDDARRNQGSWDKAKDKWRKMIKDKKMGGMQLFADRGFQSEFIKAYGITSIPRFLLIDPQGNIVNSNAPRPSQPQLKTLLDGLL